MEEKSLGGFGKLCDMQGCDVNQISQELAMLMCLHGRADGGGGWSKALPL